MENAVLFSVIFYIILENHFNLRRYSNILGFKCYRIKFWPFNQFFEFTDLSKLDKK